MIWVITAMLVYHDVDKPKMTDYMIKSFDSKYECIEYTWQNKVDMIEELFDIHKEANGKKLKTCLLYTSPSPRDVEESRMPSSA